MITFLQKDGSRPLLLAIASFILAVCLWNPAGADEGNIQLPDSYAYDQIYAPPLAGLSGLVASHNETIYVRHLGPEGEVRVSRLEAAQSALTRVLTLPPWDAATAVVGGPGDSFFIQVGTEIRQVQSDGSYTLWSSAPPAAMPEFFTKDGRMLGIGQAGTALVQMFPDGSTATLSSGFSGIYDVIASADGTIFISDFPSARVVRLNPDGSSSTVTTIVKDNTDLAIDQLGNLYINNAASGFARVDLETGHKTPMIAPLAACPAVQSPALVVFDKSGRAIFGSWVANALTWADFTSGDGGLLGQQPWANTPAADIGPDDDLYMGVTGCGSDVPSQIVRFTVEGETEVVADGLIGNISGLALDQSGGIYVSLATETSAGIYYVADQSSPPALVPDSAGIDSGSLAVHPLTNRLFAYLGSVSQQPAQVIIGEFASSGPILHHVLLPKAPQEFLIDFAPDGTLYAYVSEADRFMSGPYVDRWIFSLNLSSGTATEVASAIRDGCCPLGSFSVDGSGTIWWLLNPDSLLYQIPQAGGLQLFGSNLPVDAAYANRNSQDDIFLNMPEGLFRIWIPTSGERIQLVDDLVSRFVFYDVLNAGQGRALSAKLQAIAAALERGQTAVAYHQTNALLAQIESFVQAGILDETEADILIQAVDMYILSD